MHIAIKIFFFQYFIQFYLLMLHALLTHWILWSHLFQKSYIYLLLHLPFSIWPSDKLLLFQRTIISILNFKKSEWSWLKWNGNNWHFIWNVNRLFYRFCFVHKKWAARTFDIFCQLNVDVKWNSTKSANLMIIFPYPIQNIWMNFKIHSIISIFNYLFISTLGSIHPDGLAFTWSS